MAEWDSLPERLKESNREAAHIFAMLQRIGCSVHEAGGDADLVTFADEEIELMARRSTSAGTRSGGVTAGRGRWSENGRRTSFRSPSFQMK